MRLRLWFALRFFFCKGSTMAANRCSTCALDYPVGAQYLKCLRCGGKTSHALNVKAMPPEELAEIKKEAAEAKPPPTDDEVKAALDAYEEKYEAIYKDAEAEADRRNAIGGTWTAADILDEEWAKAA